MRPCGRMTAAPIVRRRLIELGLHSAEDGIAEGAARSETRAQTLADLPEESLTLESSLEEYQTKKLDTKLFSWQYISTLIIKLTKLYLFYLIIEST